MAQIHDNTPKYKLKLFIAGNEPNSIQAINNINDILDSRIKDRYKLEIIDILNDFQSAIDHGVLVTPMLIIIEPLPETTIVGTLSNAEKVKAALRL
ncbi:MAG: circadian clock KaiB family protein [Candidatus Magnetomorum sp.]|nr:circadian clock KaiB family protein [Candidatus Magnetomorum sp.]